MIVSTVFYCVTFLQLACLIKSQLQNNSGIELLAAYADRHWFSLNECDDICGIVRTKESVLKGKNILVSCLHRVKW